MKDTKKILKTFTFRCDRENVELKFNFENNSLVSVDGVDIPGGPYSMGGTIWDKETYITKLIKYLRFSFEANPNLYREMEDYYLF
jgi:hypothetical protein